MSTRTIRDRTFASRRPPGTRATIEQPTVHLQGWFPVSARKHWMDGKSPVAPIITNLEGGSGKVEGVHWGAYGMWSEKLPVPVKTTCWDSNFKLEVTFGLGEPSHYEFPHSGAVKNFSAWQDCAYLPNLQPANRAKEDIAMSNPGMQASRG